MTLLSLIETPSPAAVPHSVRRRTAGTRPRTAAPKAMPMSPASSLERAKRPVTRPSNDFGNVVATLTVPCVAEDEEWRRRM